MADQAWIAEQGFTGDALTSPEAIGAMNKYESREAFDIGAVNAMKSVGSPFRLPKTLDSLPDDAVRADFHTKVGELLGRDITSVTKAEDLADVNFADGLADASKVNEGLKTAFTEMVVGAGMSKSLAQKLITWNNTMATQSKNKTAEDATTAAGKVLTEVQGLYGGQAGVERHENMLSALIAQHGGLTAAEGETLNGILTKSRSEHVVLNKALFNMAKKIMPESTTTKVEQPGTTPKKVSLAARQDRDLPHTAGHLWGNKLGTPA